MCMSSAAVVERRTTPMLVLHNSGMSSEVMVCVGVGSYMYIVNHRKT